MENGKIDYLSKDFSSIKDNLIDYIKSYYPNTYNDFSPTSPGMMFIDTVAYVGDVLNYYIDDTLKESVLSKAEREENIINLAQSLGYMPKMTSTANTTLDIFMVVPSKFTSQGIDSTEPDWDYALTILPGLEVKSSENPDIIFRVDDYITFYPEDTSIEVKIYETDGNNVPQYYMLKKSVHAYSATSFEETIIVPTMPQKYYKLQLSKDNFIGINNVIDSNGNTWYETPYLAQDTIFIDEKNMTAESGSAPYLLNLKKVDRRFITRINKNKKVELQFGAGVSASPDELLIPNPDNIENIMNNRDDLSVVDTPLDPSNFMYTKSYGQVPFNLELTIKYLYGGGIKSNVASNVLTKISSIEFETIPSSLNSSLVDDVRISVAANNTIAATGGTSADSVDEIRQNAMAYFSTQGRAVTLPDYITRVYSMPSRYGKVAKAHIAKDSEIAKKIRGDYNPLALNLYLLGYDQDKNLTLLNNTIKNNIKSYIDRYRILTDAINILDAYIVNIGINFDIIVAPNFNKNEVLLKCIDTFKIFFNINNWSINQPIIISDLYNELFKVQGVRNVTNISVINKVGTLYSDSLYDIKSATKDGVIYPSKDPCCFEIKYLDKDIVGRAR